MIKYSKYEMIMKQSAVYESKYEYNIASSRDVADFMIKLLEADVRPEEHFFVLTTDSKGKIIGITETSIGDICSSSAGAREVFRTAIVQNASAIILVHNHPSGDVEPSDIDIKTTRKLAEAGNILGIKVLDHVIVGHGKFTSMKSEGYMD